MSSLLQFSDSFQTGICYHKFVRGQQLFHVEKSGHLVQNEFCVRWQILRSNRPMWIQSLEKMEWNKIDWIIKWNQSVQGVLCAEIIVFVPKIWKLCKVTFCQKVLYIQKKIFQITIPPITVQTSAQDIKVEYFFERHQTFWEKVISKIYCEKWKKLF